MDLTTRAETVARIARDAGALALDYFRQQDSLVIDRKGHQDFVSQADRDVELNVRAALDKAFPDDSIVGEEHAPTQGSSGFTWVIDPIDGTTCFLLGLPQWCVVLSYVIDSKPVVAVIYHAMGDEMFSATQAGGTRVNDTPVRVADSTSVTEGLIAVGAAQVAEPNKSAQFISQLVQSGGMYMRIGACALALCYVASGRLLAAFEPWVSPWDDLAGMLLVQEAGGRTNPYAIPMIVEKRPVLAACPGIWTAVEPLLRTA